MENKRGWIKIVEAFIAVMLVTGALLIVISKGYVGGDTSKVEIEKRLTEILREIELNPALRKDVLNSQNDIVPTTVSTKINERLPDYLKCEIKICGLGEICDLISAPSGSDGKAIYVKAVAIAAEEDVNTFNPKQLKLFCWTI